MLADARVLLETVGYGSEKGPFLDVGVGLDFGAAFVGNIGNRDLYDFTAVGDVVNIAARLTAAAGSGEIVLSTRVAAGLDRPPGPQVELELRGKAEPVVAYRAGV